ncbi:MAG: hypothetical protein U1F83_01405 [Verrucomicrobiota bacterium]
MPHLFRTVDGKLWKPSHPIQLTLANGTKNEGIWAGSAQEEKLTWWLRQPGNLLAQTEEVAEVAVKAEDTGKINWGAAPKEARLIFVLKTPTAGKNGQTYRLAKMVTTAATPAQLAYFRDERFSLFGALQSDGSIFRIPPLAPPSPEQGELL